MNIEIDIKNIEEFVLSDDFRNFLMSKTTNFGTAAFVLQTLLEKIDELKNMEEEYWDNILIKDYIMDIRKIIRREPKETTTQLQPQK